MIHLERSKERCACVISRPPTPPGGEDGKGALVVNMLLLKGKGVIWVRARERFGDGQREFLAGALFTAQMIYVCFP